jgi:hypothetical protein
MPSSFGKKSEVRPTSNGAVGGSRPFGSLDQSIDDQLDFGATRRLVQWIGMMCAALIGLALLLYAVLSIIDMGSVEKVIAGAEETIRYNMKDPSSVMLRDTQLSHDGKVVCGQVNARNSYGGYVGFNRFIYPLERAPSFVIDKDDDTDKQKSSFNKSWAELCP